MDTFEIIISVLGLIITVVLTSGLVQMNRYHSTLVTLLDIAESLAKQTTSEKDDELVAKLKELVNAKQELPPE